MEHLINKALVLEKLHNFVFRNYYIQSKLSLNKKETKIHNNYLKLIELLPNFREIIYNYYLENPSKELKKILNRYYHTLK